MCEQMLEQALGPKAQPAGRKTLWIVDPGDEETIPGQMAAILRRETGRIIYNNLRTNDEISEWENTRVRTASKILEQIEGLTAGDSYILDVLQLVSLENETVAQFGKKLLQMASARGVNCILLAFRRSKVLGQNTQIPELSYLKELETEADITMEAVHFF